MVLVLFRLALAVASLLLVAFFSWVVYIYLQPILAGRKDRRRARRGRC